jgi:hypothetical protein
MNTLLHTLPRTTATLSHIPGYVGKASRYAWNDLIYDPATLKREGFILSTFIQVTMRTILAWVNERHTQEAGQKDLRFREAIRTTLREYGGFTLSYVVLRKVEGFITRLLNVLQGVQPNAHASVPRGLDRLKRDIGKLVDALIHKQPVPVITPNRLEELEKTIPFVPNMNSPLGRWLTQQTEKGWLKGKNPVGLMKATRNWLPITIGSIVAVAVSGFWLEWLTLHKSQDIVNFTTKQLRKHKHKPKGIPDFNVNEFVGGVMEERWRRQQVDEPWFAGKWLKPTLQSDQTSR